MAGLTHQDSQLIEFFVADGRAVLAIGRVTTVFLQFATPEIAAAMAARFNSAIRAALDKPISIGANGEEL